MIETQLAPLVSLLDRTTRVTVLTGSGISAEWRHSGLINYPNRTDNGWQVRLEGPWIG